MAATADQAFWAFIMYVTHNPFKSIDNMTENDFWAMVEQFAAVNVTAGLTASTSRTLADYYGYGAVDFGSELDFPARNGTTSRWATDGNGIAVSSTYALNIAAVKQASYPEEQAGQ